MKTVIKLLTILLLAGCLLKMPYGYFQFVRLAGFVLFGWLAYKENQEKRPILALLCILAAILLNPIVKIHFIRQLWNIIDAILAGLLIIWVIVDLILLRYGKVKKRKAA